MFLFRHAQKSFSITSLVLFFGLFTSPANAGMIDNNTLINQALHEVNVKQVATMLEKADVQDKLIQMGVDPIAAKSRVNQLNEQELAALIEGIEELPAGGDLGGTILTVFIVLVITDMLGATDVFPFVKNINK